MYNTYLLPSPLPQQYKMEVTGSSPAPTAVKEAVKKDASPKPSKSPEGDKPASASADAKAAVKDEKKQSFVPEAVAAVLKAAESENKAKVAAADAKADSSKAAAKEASSSKAEPKAEAVKPAPLTKEAAEKSRPPSPPPAAVKAAVKEAAKQPEPRAPSPKIDWKMAAAKTEDGKKSTKDSGASLSAGIGAEAPPKDKQKEEKEDKRAVAEAEKGSLLGRVKGTPVPVRGEPARDKSPSPSRAADWIKDTLSNASLPKADFGGSPAGEERASATGWLGAVGWAAAPRGQQ
jgi:hypothetical protein